MSIDGDGRFFLFLLLQNMTSVGYKWIYKPNVLVSPKCFEISTYSHVSVGSLYIECSEVKGSEGH